MTFQSRDFPTWLCYTTIIHISCLLTFTWFPTSYIKIIWLQVRRTLSGRPLRTLDAQEEAVMLARKLYMLDGYKRSEVASHLSAK